ncbi:hypothetical protein RND71_031278 [Anisodus tanguticus]|uniref:Uncharacterized protein n=1 Tax=Anisodus tanguticus TaxID=243964 RepID=A0AAE1RBI0_9SOLA|nr:hypothetical protein RND71_031278 [Anisodus tanguticus]
MNPSLAEAGIHSIWDLLLFFSKSKKPSPALQRRNNEPASSSGMPTSVDTPQLPPSTQVVEESSQSEGPTSKRVSLKKLKLVNEDPNVLLHLTTVRGKLSVLHVSAANGQIEVLCMLLDRGVNPDILNRHKQGFARFVNIRDGSGATPLHLAARHGRPACVWILLSNEALVCASSGGYGCKWDMYRRTPYMVALKYKHEACAALLNPSSPEPLTWPSPLKFITELDAEAKALLENALIEANKDREKLLLEKTAVSHTSPSHCDSGLDIDDFEVIFVNTESENEPADGANQLGADVESMKEAMDYGGAVILSYVASALSRHALSRFKSVAIRCVLIALSSCAATINRILQVTARRFRYAPFAGVISLI